MYRRPMSPYNSRVNTYLEALERDQTISSLRKEYAHYRSIESEYDDLKYQISKAEREKKNLQQKNLQAQEDYMNKIKGNKTLISDIGAQIEEMEEKFNSTTNSITAKQTQNQKIIDDLKQAKVKITYCEQEGQKLQVELEAQQNVVATLTQSLEELINKKKEAQLKNKTQSEAIDVEFNEYKNLQEKAKSKQTLNMQLREELSALKSKKAKLQAKAQQVGQKMKDLKKKYEYCQFQSDKMSTRCLEAEKQTTKVYAQAVTLKENIDTFLTKNKDHSAKLKSLEVVLKESINGLYVKQNTKEKLAVQYADLLKDIEKSETIIRALQKENEDQQASNKGLISNLKKSIQSDEEAVKALTRKAAILNLISQS